MKKAKINDDGTHPNRVKEGPSHDKEVSAWKWLKNRSDTHDEWSRAFNMAAAQLESAATLLAEVEGLNSIRKKRPRLVARIRVFLDAMKGR